MRAFLKSSRRFLKALRGFLFKTKGGNKLMARVLIDSAEIVSIYPR
jgi:hypothetical protein